MKARFLLSIAFFTAACGAEGEPVEPPPVVPPPPIAPPPGSADAGVAFAASSEDAGMAGGPTWADDIEPLFRRACVRCHDSDHRSFDARQYEGVVGAASRSRPGLMLVAPNDLERSWLWCKVSIACEACGPDGSSCGFPMPFGEARLDETELELVREWISNGAR
jgi:hypothetical protein